MLGRAIPLSYIDSRHDLSWPEVVLGLREGWLTEADAIDYAASRLADNGSDEEVRAIASLHKEEREWLIERVSAVAGREDVDDAEVRLAWMRLILAWVFDNRHKFEDPLGIVEGIYADFGHPEEIYDLVRYNEPSNHYRPQDHSKEANLQRLLSLWEEYVKAHAKLEHRPD